MFKRRASISREDVTMADATAPSFVAPAAYSEAILPLAPSVFPFGYVPIENFGHSMALPASFQASPMPFTEIPATALPSPRHVTSRNANIPSTPPPTGSKRKSCDSMHEVVTYFGFENKNSNGERTPHWGAKRLRSDRYVRSEAVVPAVRKSERIRTRSKQQVGKPTAAAMKKKCAASTATTAAAAGVAPKKRGRKPGTKNKRPAAAAPAPAASRTTAPRAAKTAAKTASAAAAVTAIPSSSETWSGRLRQCAAKKTRC